MSEPITAEWLSSVGIHPGEPIGEHAVRIVGGTDDGWKKDSDDDQPRDEIANLVIEPVPAAGCASCRVETYRLPDLNTVALVELGVRHTRAEILDLCRALKAWAVKYPEAQ